MTDGRKRFLSRRQFVKNLGLGGAWLTTTPPLLALPDRGAQSGVQAGSPPAFEQIPATTSGIAWHTATADRRKTTGAG
jgi:hypothetical protein